jgi:hypothetical protein
MTRGRLQEAGVVHALQMKDGRQTRLVNFLIARHDGLFIFIHELISAVAANGMGDTMLVHHVIGKELFCAEEFAAP